MKKLLLLLALVSLSFAAEGWESMAFLAALCAFFVLLILYMLSYLVNSREMGMLAKQEMVQVFVTIFIIVVLVTFNAYTTIAFTDAFAEAFGETSLGHMEFAMEITQAYSDYQWELLKELTLHMVVPLGSIASTSATCSIIGTSFTYPGCIGVQVPFSSLMFATNVMLSAMLANNSQLWLLNIADTFLFPVLLPLGLFLRCFQFTRGAGGFFIAIALGFYFVYPFSIMVTAGMAQSVDIPEPPIPHNIKYPGEKFWEGMDTFTIESECNPLDLDPYAARKQAMRLVGSGAGGSGDELIDGLLYIFFIGGLFTTMLNLLITLSAVRGLASIFGAEVDISGLARIS